MRIHYHLTFPLLPATCPFRLFHLSDTYSIAGGKRSRRFLSKISRGAWVPVKPIGVDSHNSSLAVFFLFVVLWFVAAAPAVAELWIDHCNWEERALWQHLHLYYSCELLTATTCFRSNRALVSSLPKYEFPRLDIGISCSLVIPMIYFQMQLNTSLILPHDHSIPSINGHSLMNFSITPTLPHSW